MLSCLICSNILCVVFFFKEVSKENHGCLVKLSGRDSHWADILCFLYKSQRLWARTYKICLQGHWYSFQSRHEHWTLGYSVTWYEFPKSALFTKNITSLAWIYTTLSWLSRVKQWSRNGLGLFCRNYGISSLYFRWVWRAIIFFPLYLLESALFTKNPTSLAWIYTTLSWLSRVKQWSRNGLGSILQKLWNIFIIFSMSLKSHYIFSPVPVRVSTFHQESNFIGLDIYNTVLAQCVKQWLRNGLGLFCRNCGISSLYFRWVWRAIIFFSLYLLRLTRKINLSTQQA